MTEKSDQGQGCTKNPEKMNVREETSGKTGRHQWTKEPRLKGTTMSEGEDIWQDLQEGSHAGDCEAKS
jgi:hypothetical protein